MERVAGLVCMDCGKKYPKLPISACKNCWGPLEVEYDYEALRESISIKEFEKRPFDLWRYRELLPIEDYSKMVSLGDGGTPLHRCKRLEKVIGVNEIYVKDDTVNPTFSFKDRPSSIGVSKCLEFGIDVVGCASTGNLAAAVAAHAAKAGLDCFILVPETVELNKIVQMATYGAHIVAIKGTYDEANALGVMAAEYFGWGLVNINIRPYYVEGSKTLSYEIANQMEWTFPDHVIVPLGSGGLLCSVYKGFKELETIDLSSDEIPRISGTQPIGCAPIVKAFRDGTNMIPIENPDTVVKSLAIGNPASGYQVIDIIKETDGTADAPTDKEILDAGKLLAKTEGIFAEPAGSVTLATLIRLVEREEIDSDEKIVLLVTGSGFKALNTIADLLEHPVSIEPRLDILGEIVKNIQEKELKVIA